MMARGVGKAWALAEIAAPAAPGRSAKVGAPWGTKSAGWIGFMRITPDAMDVL
jgi:hypothetical protein